MSLCLAFLMAKLQLRNIEKLEIDDMPIAFSVGEFMEIWKNKDKLIIIFDDLKITKVD